MGSENANNAGEIPYPPSGMGVPPPTGLCLHLHCPCMFIHELSSFVMSTAFRGLFVTNCIILPNILALSCLSVIIRKYAEVLHTFACEPVLYNIVCCPQKLPEMITWILKGNTHMLTMKPVFTIIVDKKPSCVLQKHYTLIRNIKRIGSSTLLLFYVAKASNG